METIQNCYCMYYFVAILYYVYSITVQLHSFMCVLVNLDIKWNETGMQNLGRFHAWNWHSYMELAFMHVTYL